MYITNMYTSKYIIYICVVITSGVTCRALDETPVGRCIGDHFNGICVLARSCDYVLDLIKSGQIDRVKLLGCGFEGVEAKACCPNANLIVFRNDGDEVATSRSTPDIDSSPTSTTLAASSTTTARSTTMTRNRITSPPKRPYPFPDRSVCGVDRGQDRIIGGDIAGIDEFPWLARIKFLKDKKETYACSGTLITNQYVVTAAHCVASSTHKVISVRLGEWNFNTEQDCYEGMCSDPPVDVKVKRIISHPGYNRRDLSKDDIALIQLDHPVNFTDWVGPICLPTTEYTAAQDYYKDISYVTTGWGITELAQESPVKRKVHLNAVPFEICKVALPYIPDSSAPNIICAGGRKGVDSCRGDSGGPLFRNVFQDHQINWYLYGITSFGSRVCGTEGIPGVYTRVTNYIKWIREVITDFDTLVPVLNTD